MFPHPPGCVHCDPFQIRRATPYAAVFDADWPASGATAQVPIPAYEHHFDEENDPR